MYLCCTIFLDDRRPNFDAQHHNNIDFRVMFTADFERQARAEDPMPGTIDSRSVPRQPAATANDHDARRERRRTRAAAHHRTPSVRHLTPPPYDPLLSYPTFTPTPLGTPRRGRL